MTIQFYLENKRKLLLSRFKKSATVAPMPHTYPMHWNAKSKTQAGLYLLKTFHKNKSFYKTWTTYALVKTAVETRNFGIYLT